MDSQQGWLLAYENPLARRFDSKFFKNIPESAGVYWMLGRGDAILYIGKAKNLRNRLRSYRQIKPGQSSRKSVRLVQQVLDIRWEQCESETAALLRENYLLRTFRPPFNVLNKRPESYYFVALGASEDVIRFCLTTSPLEEGELFGAFKGRGLMRRGYGALLRLLWAALGPTKDPESFDIPSPLMRQNVPHQFRVSFDLSLSAREKRVWIYLLKKYLKGSSLYLLKALTKKLLEKTNVHPFSYHWIQRDLELLMSFFKSGPQRNHRLIRFHGLQGWLLAQEKIDDLLVTYSKSGQRG